MRLTIFLTTLLVLFSSTLVVADEDPANCVPAGASPAFLQTSEAWFGIRDTYSLIVNAMMYKGPAKDQALTGAKWQLDRVEKLSSEARLLTAKDTSFLRRQFYRYKLDKLAMKATAARVILKMGVPSWPALGNAILKVHKFWGDLKKKLKQFFSGDDDDDDTSSSGSGSKVVTPAILFDPTFQGQSTAFVQNLIDTFDEIKQISDELKSKVVC